VWLGKSVVRQTGKLVRQKCEAKKREAKQEGQNNREAKKEGQQKREAKKEGQQKRESKNDTIHIIIYKATYFLHKANSFLFGFLHSVNNKSIKQL
jgi:hypothetical protein